MTEQQHVPVDRLAAYAAGDLDATAALEVETHVLLCADCRADVEAVQRATADLAALPTVTMPDDVAARVDAAVAAADALATGPVGDVLPLKPPRRRPSFAGIAAVAAGIALAGAISVPLVTGGGSGSDEAGGPTAAGSMDEGAAITTKRLETGFNYTHDTLRTVLATAVSRRDSALYSLSSGAAEDNASPEAAPSPAPVAPDAVGGSANRRLMTVPGRLDACIASLAMAQTLPAAKVPLLVDFARFDGKPAVIVVFPTETRGRIQPDRVDVWVVGPRCGIEPGDDDALDFARFPRPEGL